MVGSLRRPSRNNNNAPNDEGSNSAQLASNSTNGPSHSVIRSSSSSNNNNNNKLEAETGQPEIMPATSLSSSSKAEALPFASDSASVRSGKSAGSSQRRRRRKGNNKSSQQSKLLASSTTTTATTASAAAAPVAVAAASTSTKPTTTTSSSPSSSVNKASSVKTSASSVKTSAVSSSSATQQQSQTALSSSASSSSSTNKGSQQQSTNASTSLELNASSSVAKSSAAPRSLSATPSASTAVPNESKTGGDANPLLRSAASSGNSQSGKSSKNSSSVASTQKRSNTSVMGRNGSSNRAGASSSPTSVVVASMSSSSGEAPAEIEETPPANSMENDNRDAEHDRNWSKEEVEKVCDRWELTDKEREHLVELGERIRDIDHYMNVPFTVVRFMRARPKSVKASEKMFRNMIQWRLDNKVDTILEDYTPPRLIREYMPGAVLVDYDKDNDPIYCERIGSADSPEMVHRFGAEHVIRHAIWIREFIAKGDWIHEYERRTGRPPCQILVVEDLAGLSTAHLDRKLLAAFQEITRLDQDNYPEAAKKIINVNAPFVFRLAWSLVKHFFDHNVAAKMVFVSHANTETVLNEYLDLKVLPKEIVPQGEGSASPGLNSNFTGGPLPPIGSPEAEEDYDPNQPSGSARKETASDSESSYSPLARSVPMAQDSDSVSQQSSKKSLPFWKRSPVRTFLRNQEKKKEERKKEEIREVREMAANRLVPRERTFSQQDRLEQLQEAKARRRAGGGIRDEASVSSGFSVDGRPKSFSENMTEFFQSHSKPTRFVVISFLLSTFFLLLHPNLIMILFGVDWISPVSSAWLRSILRVSGLLLYTFICACVHFLICDVALVYAYNALDLGSKTGREVKKFYSEKARIVVAGVSFGIYIASFGKAVAQVFMSYSVENISSTAHSLSVTLSPHWRKIKKKISEAVGEEIMCHPADDIFNSTHESMCAARSSASEAAHHLAESAQRAAESAKDLMNSLSSSIEMTTYDQAVSSWQSDAFNTARLFFSYTVVFLLIFLFLFNYFAALSKAKTKTKKNLKLQETPSPAAKDEEVEESPSQFLTRFKARMADTSSVSTPTNDARSAGHDLESEISVSASSLTNDVHSTGHDVGSEFSSVSENSSTKQPKKQKRPRNPFKRRRHQPRLESVQEAAD